MASVNGKVPQRFRLLCPICGDRSEWCKQGGRLSLKSPPTVARGDFLQVAINLSRPSGQYGSRAVVVTEFRDMLNLNSVAVVVRRLDRDETTGMVLIHVPDDLIPEMHEITSFYCGDMAVASARVMVSVL